MSPANKKRQRDTRLRSVLAVVFTIVLSVLLFLDVFIPDYDVQPLVVGVLGGMVLGLVGINVIQSATGLASIVSKDDEEDETE